MHVMKRFILSSIAAMTLAIPFTSSADAATGRTTIFINNEKQTTSSIHWQDRQYVPAVFFRKAGASVSWDERSQSVTVSIGAARVTYPSGGATIFHRKDGTYIPLRHTAEKLGMSVHYDAATQAISLRTNSGVSAATMKAVQQDDVYWLEQITEAEAGGEPYEGRVAVAAVVLNRVEDPNWPNTIQDVIFQVVNIGGVTYYQFSPVLDGRIYEVEPSDLTRRAVQDALNGVDPANGATVFYNPDKTDNRWVRERPVSTVIGNHVFSF